MALLMVTLMFLTKERLAHRETDKNIGESEEEKMEKRLEKIGAIPTSTAKPDIVFGTLPSSLSDLTNPGTPPHENRRHPPALQPLRRC